MDALASTDEDDHNSTILVLNAHNQWPVYKIYVEQSTSSKQHALQVEEGIVWSQLGTFLQEGFQRSMVNQNLYLFHEHGLITLIILDVDALNLTSSHQQKIGMTKAAPSREFEIIDLGICHFFL